MWKIIDYWNQAAVTEHRDPKSRDYLWASELGGPDIDVALKTRGVKYTNPPNERSRRKFMAGNIWEGVFEMILESCQLVRHREKRVDIEVCGQRITGRSDFISGGKPDLQAAEQMIVTLPESFQWIARQIWENIRSNGRYDDQVLELKAVSSFAFERVLKTKKPLGGHALQCYTYMHAEGLPGRVVYICKDDCRVHEVNAAGYKDQWMEEIKIKKKVIQTGEADPEPLILKEEKFSKNLGVEYSPYLTRVYGFKTPDDYRAAVDKKIARWNRVLARRDEGKKMTNNNILAIEEMKQEGFNL